MSGNLGGTMGGNWRPFLRALADEVDSVGGAAGRDALLREVGRRLARGHPLREASRIDVLELEINDALAGMGWGSASLRVSEADRALLIEHTGLPGLGGAGDPPGTWLSAVLEGVYEVWMAALPGADSSLSVRRVRATADGEVSLRYGRG